MAEIHKLTKSGKTIYPASVTSAIVHPELRTSLNDLINEYNVSTLYPTGGVDGTNIYNLNTAILLLDGKLNTEEKRIGTKVNFIDSNSEYVQYIFTGTTFTDVSNWSKFDPSLLKGIDENIVKLGELDPSSVPVSPETTADYANKALQDWDGNDLRKAMYMSGVLEYEEFSTSKEYAVGKVISYLNKAYKFIAPHSAGAWDESQVEETSLKREVGNEIYNLRSNEYISYKRKNPFDFISEIYLPSAPEECRLRFLKSSNGSVYYLQVFPLDSNTLIYQGGCHNVSNEIIELSGEANKKGYAIVHNVDDIFVNGISDVAYCKINADTVKNLYFQPYISAHLNNNKTFGGIISTSTNAPTDGLDDVFYLATVKGEYSSFNLSIPNDGLYIISYEDGAWKSEAVFEADENVSYNSNGFVPSKNIYSALYSKFFQDESAQTAFFVKELYIESNIDDEKLLDARIYKGSSQNYFQLWYDGSLAFQKKLISDEVIRIEGTINGYVILRNTDKFIDSTPNELLINEKVTNINNCPIISSYINNLNLQNGIIHTYVVDKNGNGDYTSLTECIEEAEKHMNSVVYVNAGVYDIEQEFKDLYGEDYFETYTVSKGKGIVLKNRIKVIFSSNSSIIFNYLGENTDVLHEFSPFNAGDYGFTLENLTISASRCRYIVHDERGSSADNYVNKYINCNFYLDNTNNTQGYPQCIGGGLGTNGYIEVNGCVISTKLGETNYANSLSYHNTSVEGAKSHISIKNCYFPNYCNCRFGYYGNSTEITKIELIGNYFGRPYTLAAETSGSSIVNMEVIEWNNEVLHA